MHIGNKNKQTCLKAKKSSRLIQKDFFE